MAEKFQSKYIQTHDKRENLVVDFFQPGHPDRGDESPLFLKTKKILEQAKVPPLIIPRSFGKRCYICGKTEDELKEPLESHHFSLEWSFAFAQIDWKRVEEDHPRYDWDSFDKTNPISFVDDQAEQGLLLCKKHHTGKDTGIHELPFSIWILQRYLVDGTKWNETEVISKGKDWK